MLHCVYKVNKPWSQTPANSKPGGEAMPENVINILEAIKAAKGQEYVQGMVDMANMLAPIHKDSETTD
jgi:hypothetical protein